MRIHSTLLTTPSLSITTLPPKPAIVLNTTSRVSLRGDLNFHRTGSFVPVFQSEERRFEGRNGSKCCCGVGEFNNSLLRGGGGGGGGGGDGDFIVVNFYHFVFIENPQAEVAKHLRFLKDLNIHGRIYVNEQGINAQYSGPSEDALSYAGWLREDERFFDILVQISCAINGHAFPKLKVQFKPLVQVIRHISLFPLCFSCQNISLHIGNLACDLYDSIILSFEDKINDLFPFQLDGGISNLPVLDPSMRATPLAPSEWKKRLEAVNKSRNAPDDKLDSDLVLLDLRNGYEWDIGHFRGAKRPEVDCFRSTLFGQSQSEVISPDPLAGVDKEKTDVLMYCTGGIRCDVYSTILRKKGYKNLYTLKGGVSHYLKNEGPSEWIGNLFVFDSRLSLPPSGYNPKAMVHAHMPPQVSEHDQFSKCYICGSLVHELRHRNCANLDCNLLFLCCKDCVDNFHGCCCSSCTTAPRIRPVLPGHERYKKWHIYRDMEVKAG